MDRKTWFDKVCTFTKDSSQTGKFDYFVRNPQEDSELYNTLLYICANYKNYDHYKVSVEGAEADLSIYDKYVPGGNLEFTSADYTFKIKIGTGYDTDPNVVLPMSFRIQIWVEDPSSGSPFADFTEGDHQVVLTSDAKPMLKPEFIFGSHETGVSIFEGLRKRVQHGSELKSNNISEMLQELVGMDLNHVHSIGDYENFEAENIAWVKGEIGPNGGPGDRNWHPDETESSGN